MESKNNNEGMIRFAGLWKETSQMGEVYYSGMVGKGMKLLILRNKQKTPGSNQPDFQAFLKQVTHTPSPTTTTEDGGEGEL